jgi:hypothetical protein
MAKLILIILVYLSLPVRGDGISILVIVILENFVDRFPVLSDEFDKEILFSIYF